MKRVVGIAGLIVATVALACAELVVAQPPEGRGSPEGGGPGGQRRGPPSPERFVEHAMEFDADGDGKLDRSELEKFAAGMMERMRGGPGGGPGRGGPGRPERALSQWRFSCANEAMAAQLRSTSPATKASAMPLSTWSRRRLWRWRAPRRRAGGLVVGGGERELERSGRARAPLTHRFAGSRRRR